MKCSQCEADARALCKFCGRAVCEKRIGQFRFVTGFTSAGGILAFTDNGISVEDAFWCQKCHSETHRTV